MYVCSKLNGTTQDVEKGSQGKTFYVHTIVLCLTVTLIHIWVAATDWLKLV